MPAANASLADPRHPDLAPKLCAHEELHTGVHVLQFATSKDFARGVAQEKQMSQASFFIQLLPKELIETENH